MNKNIVRNIENLGGFKLVSWVKNKFKENGHDVSSGVAGLLIDMIGNESWSLINEINKLSNYKKGGTITEKDVNLLVGRKEYDSIFDLTDAVGNKNRARAFEIMYRLINTGNDAHYILSMFAYHFENLLLVCDLADKSFSSGMIAKKYGMHPFVVRKAVNQAAKFQQSDLLAKFNYLAELDVASKSGQVNLEDALYNFVVS